jgi:site-specific recombinase XerD
VETRDKTRRFKRSPIPRYLRRTDATALHDSGVPLKTISVMLGHSEVTTTIRYLAIKNENLKQAGAILDSKYQAPSDRVSLPLADVS